MLEYCDGFDAYSSSQFQRRYPGSVGSKEKVSGRYGEGEALSFNDFTNSSWMHVPITSRTEYYWGLDLRIYNNIGFGDQFIYLYDSNGTTIQTIDICSANTGEILSSSWGNSSAGLISVDTWYNIQFHVVIHPTEGVWQVKLDGILVIDQTGINTGNTNISQLSLHNQYQTRHVDNFWIFNTLGYHSNTWPTGLVIIQTLSPNGDGTYQQFVPSSGSTHYTMVDDIPEADDDDTYTEGGNTLSIEADSFTLPPTHDISVGVVNKIHGVNLFNIVRKTNVPSRIGRSIFKSGSTEYQGTNNEISLSYSAKNSLLLAEDPNTNSEWLISAINASEIGFKTVVPGIKYQYAASRIKISTSFIQGCGKFSNIGSGSKNFSSNVTAGNTIFGVMGSVQGIASSGTRRTMSDNLGNVYELLSETSTAGTTLMLWKSVITTGGACTVSWSFPTSGFTQFSAIEMSGAIGTFPSVTGNNISGTSVSVNIPTTSPQQNSLIIIGGLAYTEKTFTNGSATLGWTNYQSGSGGSIAIGYETISVDGSYNTSLTADTTTYLSAVAWVIPN